MNSEVIVRALITSIKWCAANPHLLANTHRIELLTKLPAYYPAQRQAGSVISLAGVCYHCPFTAVQ